MSQRRFFLKNSLGGAFAVFLSSNLVEPFSKKKAVGDLISSTESSNVPYKVKIVYTFESESARQNLLAKIENVGVIHAINNRYEQSGQILSFEHKQQENIVTNIYVFDSEKSYLAWQSEMVLAKVVNQNYCSTVVAQRNLGNDENGINKLTLIEVKSPLAV